MLCLREYVSCHRRKRFYKCYVCVNMCPVTEGKGREYVSCHRRKRFYKCYVCVNMCPVTEGKGFISVMFA